MSTAHRTQSEPSVPTWLSFLSLVGIIVLLALSVLFGNVDDEAETVGSENVPVEYSDRFKLDEAQTSRAKQYLSELTVADPKSMDEYKNSREELFGNWSSGEKQAQVPLAGNGCDTRNDILARDMLGVTYSDEKHCKVATGRLWDAYGTADNPSDHWIDFTAGKGTSMAVQIDHVVALGNVWASRPDDMTEQERYDIANDPINLLAVDGPQNGAKQDKNFAEWKPNNKDIHCFYAASQIQVKHKYRLSVTQAEHDALAQALATCPAGV